MKKITAISAMLGLLAVAAPAFAYTDISNLNTAFVTNLVGVLASTGSNSADGGMGGAGGDAIFAPQKHGTGYICTAVKWKKSQKGALDGETSLPKADENLASLFGTSFAKHPYTLRTDELTVNETHAHKTKNFLRQMGRPTKIASTSTLFLLASFGSARVFGQEPGEEISNAGEKCTWP